MDAPKATKTCTGIETCHKASNLWTYLGQPSRYTSHVQQTLPALRGRHLDPRQVHLLHERVGHPWMIRAVHTLQRADNCRQQRTRLVEEPTLLVQVPQNPTRLNRALMVRSQGNFIDCQGSFKQRLRFKVLFLQHGSDRNAQVTRLVQHTTIRPRCTLLQQYENNPHGQCSTHAMAGSMEKAWSSQKQRRSYRQLEASKARTGIHVCLGKTERLSSIENRRKWVHRDTLGHTTRERRSPHPA